MLRRTLVLAAAVALAAGLVSAPPGAVAHGPKGTKIKGANGGEIVDVEGGHLELVVRLDELVVYVTDLKDAPLATAGLTARAIVQDGSKQAVLQLAPREPNLLVAALAAPLAKEAKVAISATLAKDGKPVQARFVVK